MPASPRQASIISGEGDFLALREEWDRLFAQAAAPYPSQGFTWCRCTWEMLLRPRGGRLRCVAIRTGGRLRLVWPTVVMPHHRLWSVLVPLNVVEYTDVLAQAGSGARELAALAWKTLQEGCRADFIFLERVRAGSLLSDALRDAGVVVSRIRPAPCVTWAGAGWEAYYRGLSKTLRSQTERRQRRLTERGRPEFEVVRGGERYRALATWLLEQKAAWLARTGRRSEWIGAPDYTQFVRAIPDQLAAESAPGAVTIFALRLGETVLAAELNCIGEHFVEFMNGAYDPAYEQFSPGHILRAYTLRWAFDRGLAYDFRPGEERYKEAYANGGCETANYYLTNTARGRLHQQLGATLKRLSWHAKPPFRG